MAWLDLANAFGSIHHHFLKQLLLSLPIPAKLRRILDLTYSDNRTVFALGSDTVTIQLTAGVRQGDALSATIFNLAVEPLLRKQLEEEDTRHLEWRLKLPHTLTT